MTSKPYLWYDTRTFKSDAMTKRDPYIMMQGQRSCDILVIVIW